MNISNDVNWDEATWKEINDAVVAEVLKVRTAQKVFPTMVLETNPTDIPNDVIDFTDLSIKEGQAKQFVEICQEFPLAIAQVSTKQDDVVFSANRHTVSKRIERRYEMRVTANVDTTGIF